MRLLTICHHTQLLGANRSLLHLIKGLRKKYEIQVLVFCPSEGPFTAALIEENIPYVVNPFANWGYSLFSTKLWLFPWVWWRSKQKVLPEVIAAAKDFNPDVIHSNSSLVALGWQLAERLDKPHIWHIREFGWLDYKIVFPLGQKQFREKLNKAIHVITISNALKTKIETGLLIKPKVIYNGIGTVSAIKKSYEAGQVQQKASQFIFLNIGLVHPAKRQLTAVRAFKNVFKKHNNARLVIAGIGRKSYEYRLRFQAWKDGTSQAIEFCGFVTNPVEVYSGSKVVLVCSRHEAMGRVIAEAMSYGKPVIGYKAGAIPEMIESGVQGEHYESEAELTKIMIQMIENPDKLRNMGLKGFERATSFFSDEVYVEKFYNLMSNAGN